jgi:hypothetical protein
LLDGTTAYAHDVEDLVNPLYTDIDDTNIRLGADIQIKKLENLASGKIIVGSSVSVPTAVAMTGDASISDLGVITVTGGSADEIAVTDDTTTDASMYPVWVTANTGDLPAYVSSTKLYFNPLTGLLTATGFSGPLTGNCSGTSGGLANGTYNYGAGAVIVNSANADTVDNYHASATPTAGYLVAADGSGFVTTPASDPTTNYQVANKKYVDDSIPNSKTLAKAWGYFVTDGSVTITDSNVYNCSVSVYTSGSDKWFKVDFSSAQPDAKYSVAATVEQTGDSFGGGRFVSVWGRTTTYFYCVAWDVEDDTPHGENNVLSFVVFGN